MMVDSVDSLFTLLHPSSVECGYACMEDDIILI